ncbi:MAG: DEAD/DEAH box helicase [Armatimonadetes bacterium]|nr:DEAD/DEAH box helicase [Armatimonadota bacterium]
MFDEVTLSFDQGTVTLSGNLPETLPTWFERDERVDTVRAPAMWYRDTVRWLTGRRIDFTDDAGASCRLPLRIRTEFRAHPYQREALRAWLDAEGRGSIILPTGAGKTFVALGAMLKTGYPTLVIAPTIDLMNQWYALIADAFGTEVGILGGGYHEVRPLTVSTYDSAFIYSGDYGNRFDLLIFDEVHHLPSPKNRQIALMSTARCRLGLTATYERQDGAHRELESLVGPVVYRLGVKDLKGSYLSEFEIVRISAKLTDYEAERYKKACGEYYGFLRQAEMKTFGSGWNEFIKMSAYDERARRALVAKGEMKRLIAGAERKLEVLDMLLKQHIGDKVIIFTEHNDLVYRISREFLIPAITHETRARERKWILDGFKGNLFERIVTSKVLNEGIDVPSAKVAIILGGSASPREHLQRLGRILRRSASRSSAVLYEVVASATAEMGVSTRRKKNVNT